MEDVCSHILPPTAMLITYYTDIFVSKHQMWVKQKDRQIDTQTHRHTHRRT